MSQQSPNSRSAFHSQFHFRKYDRTGSENVSFIVNHAKISVTCSPAKHVAHTLTQNKPAFHYPTDTVLNKSCMYNSKEANGCNLIVTEEHTLAPHHFGALAKHSGRRDLHGARHLDRTVEPVIFGHLWSPSFYWISSPLQHSPVVQFRHELIRWCPEGGNCYSRGRQANPPKHLCCHVGLDSEYGLEAGEGKLHLQYIIARSRKGATCESSPQKHSGSATAKRRKWQPGQRCVEGTRK